MKHLFISAARSLLSSWREAFGSDAVLLPPTARGGLSGSVLYWLDWHTLGESDARAVFQSLMEASARVVVMSAKPSAEEAMRHFTLGARGYCHQRAAATQLREIAVVIQHGGVWLGADAMQRLLRGTLTLLPGNGYREPDPALLETLTARERAVAREVARGASNREIATSLGMSERTVKAHLSNIFEKLRVRDRVQLALILNNIPLG